MSKPNILSTVDELNKAGYCGGTTNLGQYSYDNPTLLDEVTHNGIYAFIGGPTEPMIQSTDEASSYSMWMLSVECCDTANNIIQRVEKVPTDTGDISVIQKIRYRVNGVWSEFLDPSGEVSEKIGDLNSLDTTDKSNLVGAINELSDKITNNDTAGMLKKHMLGGI